MLEYSLTGTIQRRVGTLRRLIELMAVCLLALMGTLINLAFGWPAFLFATRPAGDRKNAAVFPTVETSKEF